MATSTAYRGTELTSQDLAVSRATKTADIISSLSDPIAQNIPQDRRSLDRLLAYCRRHLGKVRGVAQKQNGNILPIPTPQPPTTTDPPHRATLRAQVHASIQERSPDISHSTDPSATVPDSNQNGLDEDLETDTFPRGSLITPGAHTSEAGILAAETLPATSEAPEETEHDILPSISETVIAPAIGLGHGPHRIAPNATPSGIISSETTINRPLQDSARPPPPPPPLPEITFEPLSGPATGSGFKTNWKRLPRFRFFGDNVFLATSLAPDEEHLRQWRDVWQPTLLHKVDTLSIDEADIFVFDLKMVGSSPKADTLKPTILAICSNTVMQKLKHGLEEIVKEITPKEVDFLVIGRDITLASPGAVQKRRPGSKIDLEVYFMRDMLEGGRETNAYKAQVYLQNHVNGSHASTVGGYILVGTSLFALTTGHSLFSSSKKPLSGTRKPEENVVSLPFKGNLESYSWSLKGGKWGEKNSQERSFDASLIPTDWALVSLSPSSDPSFDSPIDLIKSLLKAKQFVPRPAATVFKAIEKLADVVDGDSGSWVVSQSDNELCGYIFARVVGLEWAYMLPICTIIEDIRRVAPRENNDLVAEVTLFSVAEMERAMVDRKKHLSGKPEEAQPSNVSVPTEYAIIAEMRAEIEKNYHGSSEVMTQAARALPMSTELDTYSYSSNRNPGDTNISIPLSDSLVQVNNPTNVSSFGLPVRSQGDQGQIHNAAFTTRDGVTQWHSDMEASWIPQFAESTPSIVPFDKSLDDEQDIEPGSIPNDGRSFTNRGQNRIQRFITSISAVFKRSFPRTYRHYRKYASNYILFTLLVNDCVFFAGLGTYAWLVVYCGQAVTQIRLVVIGIIFGFIALILVLLIGNRISHTLEKYALVRNLWGGERGFLWHTLYVACGSFVVDFGISRSSGGCFGYHGAIVVNPSKHTSRKRSGSLIH
ncbi:hypothetical protein VTL71DRAFT_15241 [Oculimacula yallundae]|uniref:Uncharacterized protein n=1 Tax=Oculimacula yallundae TaxID=86028 RepID=A0ABR4CI76_9HELO